MGEAREQFLQRVRQAVAEGNRAGATIPLESRGDVGYQGAGADPVAQFCAALAAAGGLAYRAADRDAARAQVLELVMARSVRRVLLGRGDVVDALQLSDVLRARGMEVMLADGTSPEQCRDPFFAADIGITGVDYLIAETGSLLVMARPDNPRSVSLLPPVHIVVAETAQLLPDVFDFFARLDAAPKGLEFPSCVTFITGPSKTGDIELRLVTGVHGPGEVHVVLI